MSHQSDSAPQCKTGPNVSADAIFAICFLCEKIFGHMFRKQFVLRFNLQECFGRCTSFVVGGDGSFCSAAFLCAAIIHVPLHATQRERSTTTQSNLPVFGRKKPGNRQQKGNYLTDLRDMMDGL